MGFPFHHIRNFLKGKNRVNSLEVIHSQDSFRMILERERARSERTGHTFSLVLFDCNNGKGIDTALLEGLGQVLVQKVRLSDELGWFEEGKTLGALLPGTPVEGALQFTEIIREKIGESESSLKTTVYTYPNTLNSYDIYRKKADDDITRSNHILSINASLENSPIPPLNGISLKPMEVIFACPIPYWKRMIDIVVATLLLVCLTPLFILIVLLIKIVSPGPVFYRQQRIGYQGKRFLIWKFRTMHVDNDAEGHRRYLNHLLENDVPMTKMDDRGDKRIIPFGRFLRYSCLDELPQLFNVLKREMSLVGPRPCLPYEAEKYLHWHARRFDTVPGMTGLWQVTGKNRATFKEMIRLDIRYSRKMSPVLDTKILLLTGPAILGMVSEPFMRKMEIDRDAQAFSPSRKEQIIRG